ncbi:MAG TPA: DUF4214 domain-containing protein [Pyrinomonadaceae bacterium]|nr:DUF4214 domain-containing protein [Pyrinomonadaceae bacterium]
MPLMRKRTRVLASFLLVLFLIGAGLFKIGAGAAEPRQALNLSGSSSSIADPAALASARNILDSDVQVTITTYDEGRISRQITVNTISHVASNSSNRSTVGSVPMAPAIGGDIVLSQIYSNGGNPGSAYQNNYIEFFNRTDSAIDFNGWPIYFTSATGTFNQSIAFTSSRGLSIAAHKYLLIRLGPDSANGAPVPADLFIPEIPGIPSANLSPSGKIFFTRPNNSIFGSSCPLPNPEIVDFVGYGTTANCFEGTGPAPTTANTKADVRKLSGCTDRENNANDFVADEPSPHNSFSAASNCPNLIDNAEFFVRQHYADFLNRVPDSDGLAYWTNEITSCGADAACVEIKRINVSAAFFLSIEFQETGYLVERIYKSAYGEADGFSQQNTPANPHPIKVPVIRFSEFLADSQLVAKDVIVGQPGWPQQLENNKVAFTQNFVARSRFTTQYPTTKTPAQFVGELYVNAGITPATDELTSVINEFGGAPDTGDAAARARALRRVAENTMLAQQETNKAFVLMQYFGYLRRNPNDPPDSDHTGYDFWLTKLNDFNGNFVNAEMVKAFLDSIEYRQRF